MSVRIGLTGGIAAGKSTVAARLAELGAYVIDYDVLAREVVKPGSEGLQAIVQAFGEQALDASGQLNRAWMASQIFGQGAKADARERLDAIEHPLITALAITTEQSQADSAVIVHDIPLLADVIEQLPFSFDHVVTVEAPERVRIARMVAERGLSETQAKQRIASQSSAAERKAIADVVIDAEQSKTAMLKDVDALYAQWLAEAE